MRVGYGYDVHRFADGRKLILGGADIPFIEGLDGHSDADVLSHAIIDALLGAAALGDIGKMFPDTDERYAGADATGRTKPGDARRELQDSDYRADALSAVRDILGVARMESELI